MSDRARARVLRKLIERAVLLLDDWAEENPDDDDPSETIETIAASSIPDDDPAMIAMLEEELWTKWAVIETEREMRNEMEDDLG